MWGLCGLDYHMNQTPYSIYISIRKKFVRGHSPNAAENVKLYTNEAIGTESKVKETLLKSEITRLKHELEKKATLEEEFVKVTLKTDIENLKKENNSSSVAIKRMKKEKIEIVKNYDKKIEILENKLANLYEFKNSKMSEERDLRLKLKKEAKKAKQLAEKQLKLEDSSMNGDSDLKDHNLNVSVLNPFDVLGSTSKTLSSMSGSPALHYVPTTPLSDNTSSRSQLLETTEVQDTFENESAKAKDELDFTAAVSSPSTPESSSDPSSSIPSSESVASYSLESSSSSSDVSSVTNNNVLNTQMKQDQEEILAALRIFNEKIDKCLEVTGQLT